MAMKKGSRMQGPLRLTKANGSEGRTSAITVAALLTNTAETYEITDSEAEVNDVVIASPATAPEAGWGIEAAWVDAAGTIKVRARNHSGDTLTGGALTVCYQILK